MRRARPAERPSARVPRPLIRWLAFGLACLGWWLSLDLFRMSAGLPSSNPLIQAVCRAEAGGESAWDCGSVLASDYARVRLSRDPSALRLPLAAFGMGYFAFVGFWYLIIGCPTRARWPWHLVLVAVVGVGLLVSWHNVWLMANVLHRWCAGCLSVHLVNGLIAVLTLLAFPWRREPMAYEPHPRGRLVIAVFTGAMFLFLLHVAVALAVTLSSHYGRLAATYQSITQDPAFVQWDYQRQPLVELPPAPGRWVGPDDAPNELVVYLDYGCSACARAHQAIEAAIARHPGAMRVSLRNFPLATPCNHYVKIDVHPGACAAAAAAEAVRDLGGADLFARMARLLYERQAQLRDADVAAWAGALGLDADAVAERSKSPGIAARIEQDIEQAHTLGISSTPALYLNGRRLNYWDKPEFWDALLESVADGMQARGHPRAP